MAAKQHEQGITKAEVLKLLEREADFDGIIIVSMSELARELGVSSTAVHYHVHTLENEGALSIENTGINHQLRQITLA